MITKRLQEILRLLLLLLYIVTIFKTNYRLDCVDYVIEIYFTFKFAYHFVLFIQRYFFNLFLEKWHFAWIQNKKHYVAYWNYIVFSGSTLKLELFLTRKKCIPTEERKFFLLDVFTIFIDENIGETVIDKYDVILFISNHHIG